MRRPLLTRRVAFAAMVAVMAWSMWAMARPHEHPTRTPRGRGLSARPTAIHPSAPEGEKAAATGTAEQATGEDEGPASMNWTEFGGETPPFIAMLINFGILAAGYYLLGKKPVAAGLQARRAAITKDIEDAQRMRHEAEERAKLYQGKLEKLEEEVQMARESLVHAGEADHDRIIKEAEAKAERMRKDAQFLVEQELKQIRGDLWRESVDAAVRAAEELLKARVTPSDHERLAEDYLADLARSKAAPSSRSAA